MCLRLGRLLFCLIRCFKSSGAIATCHKKCLLFFKRSMLPLLDNESRGVGASRLEILNFFFIIFFFHNFFISFHNTEFFFTSFTTNIGPTTFFDLLQWSNGLNYLCAGNYVNSHLELYQNNLDTPAPH